MATLSEKLILADRVSELLKASTDREYRNKLLVEFWFGVRMALRIM
ncbi:MAG: hypothetical protein ACLTER_10440 [Ruminococcus sp.]